MTIARRLILATATLLAVGWGAAEAAQFRTPSGGGDRPTAAVGQFVGNGGPVADTCDQSYPSMPEACDIDKLTERCDAAGGGMSSLPGGGVECDLGPE